ARALPVARPFPQDILPKLVGLEASSNWLHPPPIRWIIEVAAAATTRPDATKAPPRLSPPTSTKADHARPDGPIHASTWRPVLRRESFRKKSTAAQWSAE